MKFLKQIIILFLIANLLQGCYKEKTPEGEYVLATSWTSPLSSGDSTLSLENASISIIESDKTAIKVLSFVYLSELVKDKNMVTGSMKVELNAPVGIFRYYDPIHISGTIEKYCDGYRISGDFDAIYTAQSMNNEGEVVTWTSSRSGQFSIFPKN